MPSPTDQSVDIDATVIEQIDRYIQNHIFENYFSVATNAASAEEKLRELVQREDKTFIISTGYDHVREVETISELYSAPEVAGFAWFGIYTAEEINEFSPVPAESLYPSVDFPAGVLRHVSVLEEYQMTTVVARLLVQSLEGLLEMDSDVILGFFLQSGDNSRNLAELVDGTTVDELELGQLDNFRCSRCDTETECECTIACIRVDVNDQLRERLSEWTE